MGCAGSIERHKTHSADTVCFIKDGTYLDSFNDLKYVDNVNLFNKQLEHLCKTDVLFEYQDMILEKIHKMNNIEGLRIITTVYPMISSQIFVRKLVSFIKGVDLSTVNKEQIKSVVTIINNTKMIIIKDMITFNRLYSDTGVVELFSQPVHYARNIIHLKELSDEKLFKFHNYTYMIHKIELDSNPIFINDIILQLAPEYNKDLYSRLWKYKHPSVLRNYVNILNYLERHRDAHREPLLFRAKHIKTIEDFEWFSKMKAILF